MPKKIHVVDLSAPGEKVEEVESDNNDDKDEVSQIKEAIKIEEEEEEQQQQIEEPKPKPKRKAAAKKIKVEPIIEPEPEPVKEPEPEPEPKVETKIDELVKCPNCEKQMTKRTLRYNHKTCPGKKIDRNEIPVKKREKTVVETNISIPEEIIEKEVNKRIQDKLLQKIRVKEEKIKKLSSQIA